MLTRLRGIARSSGLIWLAAIAVMVAIGCGGSPLLSLQFANLLGGRAAGGGSQPSTQGTGTVTLRQSCDLDTNKRGIFVVLENQAQQFLRYSITFVASAGPGGFVCSSDENTYFNAGYRDTVLDANGGRGSTIGCDIIQLLGGTRLLTFHVKNNMPQNVGGGTANLPVAQIPLNGNTFIPLPELIVLGDGETENNGSKIFTCTGNDLCTQRGFIYTDVANTPIAFVNASRTQDTVCNARAGTAPEWRLADINKADNQASPFQYPAGSTIVLVVLDRASNVNANVNQVIWQVTDVNGNVIHAFRP